MRKLLAFIFAFALVGGGMAATAHAESNVSPGLSASQITSVANLLESFGVASSTIARVEVALSASVQTTQPEPRCPVFSEDLFRGRSDSDLENEDVASLQGFLSAHAGFSSAVTGYFGSSTEAALKSWQEAHGVPPTGYLGAMTRAAMGRDCGPQIPSSTITLSAAPSAGTAPLSVNFSLGNASSTKQYILTFGDGSISGAFLGNASIAHTYARPGDYTATLSPYVACMYSNPRCEIMVMMLAQTHIHVTGTSTATSAPSIFSVEPSTGPVGTTVSVGGDNFTASNTVLFNGNVVAKNVAAKKAIFFCPMIPAGSTETCGSYAQTLSFTVPGSMAPYCAAGQVCPLYALVVRPGAYALTILNANGTSTPRTFTVASSTGTNE